VLLTRAVDTVLDRGVVLGYSRIGLAVRQRLSGWPSGPVRLDGKVVLVTGGTSGVGLAAARGLAELGARVVITGRDEQRTNRVAAHLREGLVDGDVEARVVDVSSLQSLARFASKWSGPLDVLVNNAGVMAPRRADSADGVELTFATNVLGPWVLIDRLRGSMADGGRVINVTSGGMYARRLVPDPGDAARDYAPATVYARSKRALVVITELWAQRLVDDGVHSMHPGWAQTPGVDASLPVFAKVAGPILRTPAGGADTIVWMAGAAEVGLSTGRLWMDRQPRPTNVLPWTRETPLDRERLWDELQRLADEVDSPDATSRS
jgi:NAD(P)-dependent dehydrogenase (short-subunit alcohol dehydrogenase family)